MQTNQSSTGALTSISQKKAASKPKSKPRVAFVVCEAGGGHISAARAISQALHEKYPEQYETPIVAIENMIGPFGRFLGTVYVGSYNLALQYNQYWLEPFIFNSLSSSRNTLLPFGVPHFRKALADLQPDMVVMLIHGAHEVFHASLQADGHIPNLTVVTDAVTIRDSWVHPACDHIIVSTPEAHAACLSEGIPAEKLEIVGHPMDPRFAIPAPPREELCQQYGIDPDKFTVMIMMGGAGGKKILRFSKMLAESGLPLQVVAMCGKDAWLLNQMQIFAPKSPIPIHAFGFTTDIPNLMGLCHAIVTKPGPGTIMEAMARDLPIILDDSNYTMYQEKGNVDYIVEHGIGTVIGSASELVPAVKKLVTQPEVYSHMQAQIQAHKRVDAGLQIAEHIHTRLQVTRADMP